MFSELFTAPFLYFLSYPLDKLPCLYLQTTEWLINIHQHVQGSFLLCDILYYTSLQPLPLHLRRRRGCGISSPSRWLFVRCYSVRSSCNHSRSSNGFICVRNIPNCTPRLSHKFVYNLTALSFSPLFLICLQVLKALDILQPPHIDFFEEMYPFSVN